MTVSVTPCCFDSCSWDKAGGKVFKPMEDAKILTVSIEIINSRLLLFTQGKPDIDESPNSAEEQEKSFFGASEKNTEAVLKDKDVGVDF